MGASLLTGELLFELVGNLLLVPAHFDEGPERRFVFDTGADSLFVAPQVLATDLGVDPDDPATSSCCC